MNKRIAGLAALAAMGWGQVAMAEGVNFRPRLGYGHTAYKLGQDRYAVGELKGGLGTMLVGGTVMFERFFLDVSTSAGKGDVDGNPWDLERDETALAIGWVWSGGAMFISRLDSETSFGGDTVESFATNGWAYGFGFNVAEIGKGMVGASIGLGFLRAEAKDSGGTQKSDVATGLSGGLSYSHAVTPALNLRAEAKFTRYDYYFPTFWGDVAETFQNYQLSAAYTF